MKDYKEPISNLRCCFSGECGGCTLHEDEQRCQERLLEKAADAIEQLAKERDNARRTLDQTLVRLNDETVRAERLEAESRAKEQYIAETIGKVIKERDAAIADLGKACYINLRNVRANACHFCLKLPICAKISGKQNYCCADWEWRGVQEEAR